MQSLFEMGRILKTPQKADQESEQQEQGTES